MKNLNLTSALLGIVIGILFSIIIFSGNKYEVIPLDSFVIMLDKKSGDYSVIHPLSNDLIQKGSFKENLQSNLTDYEPDPVQQESGKNTFKLSEAVKVLGETVSVDDILKEYGIKSDTQSNSINDLLIEKK